MFSSFLSDDRLALWRRFFNADGLSDGAILIAGDYVYLSMCRENRKRCMQNIARKVYVPSNSN